MLELYRGTCRDMLDPLQLLLLKGVSSFAKRRSRAGVRRRNGERKHRYLEIALVSMLAFVGSIAPRTHGLWSATTGGSIATHSSAIEWIVADRAPRPWISADPMAVCIACLP